MAIVTGGEALMDILQKEGVEYVFGIPGATEANFMDILEDHPEFKYFLCLHELAALGAAEGYARTSGKTGFVNLHTATGLAAALPSLANAYYGGVPLVITAGQQDTRLLAAEPALTGDLVKIASPFTKWSTEIIHADDIPMIMRRAFRVASHPPAGPVFVSLPINLINSSFDYEYVSGSPAFTKVHPDNDSIKLAVDFLAKAKNPAIIVEDGVSKNEALTEVVEFAEKIGAKVYQPWMADVNFPVHHPLYMYDLNINSPACRDMLEQVDVLVVIGALFFAQAIHVPKCLVPPTTKVIQIDDNPWQIGKNYPVASGIEGDIKVALTDLMSALDKKITAETRDAVKVRIQVITQEKQGLVKAFEEKAQKEKENTPISGTRLMQEIRDAIKPGTRIVDDCWSYSATLRRTLPLSEHRSYMRARSGGSIGLGLPGAIGVKLASPERPVVCISGDGSAMWAIQSLWSAAHYNVPVTFIIIANTCYRQVRIMKSILLGEKNIGRNLGTDLSIPQNDFVKLAEGMGLTAQKVTEPGELKDALEKAFNLNKPNLVEVAVDAAL
ncbi:thiamine pyrophosphate-binding protein [Chloroflexota bacterium]